MTENPLGYEKISKLLKNFAVPSIVASLVGSIYNIVDQIFIGQGVGYLGNAAINVMLAYCFAYGNTSVVAPNAFRSKDIKVSPTSK